MDKKTVSIIMGAVVIVIAGFVFWGLRQPQQPSQTQSTMSQSSTTQSDIIFYYGQECPHCQNVEKFIADNKLDDKISFEKKEVWHNTENNAELEKKAKECVLDPTKVGVPFLYARGKCYVGEIEVEDFFKKEAGLQ